MSASQSKADLIDGKGACPPEDCGGPWGYAGLKEKLANPQHEEYAELKEWMGLEEDEEWDPNDFDATLPKEAVHSV